MAEIAIDYDNTYTLFKEEIDVFVKALKSNGHSVHLVTARDEETSKITEDLSIFDHIFYTAGKAKASVVRADLFLDDSPVTLCCDFVPGAAHATPSKALHQGYKETHVLWNWEEGKFVSYVTKTLGKHANKG
jgi:hypothetical protein